MHVESTSCELNLSKFKSKIHIFLKSSPFPIWRMHQYICLSVSFFKKIRTKEHRNDWTVTVKFCEPRSGSPCKSIWTGRILNIIRAQAKTSGKSVYSKPYSLQTSKKASLCDANSTCNNARFLLTQQKTHMAANLTKLTRQRTLLNFEMDCGRYLEL